MACKSKTDQQLLSERKHQEEIQTHVQVGQSSNELRLSAGQIGAALKVTSSLLDLVLLQTELGERGDADIALGVNLERIAADLLSLGEPVLVRLEDAEGLVDQRKDVLQVAVPLVRPSSALLQTIIVDAA